MGEQTVARSLEKWSGDRVRVLHDRRTAIAGEDTTTLLGPTGAYVIDARRSKGRPDLRVQGGILRPLLLLDSGGRDNTMLVAGVHRQVVPVAPAPGTRYAESP